MRKNTQKIKYLLMVINLILLFCFQLSPIYADTQETEIVEVSSVEQANFFLIGYILSFVVGKTSVVNNLPDNIYIENNLITNLNKNSNSCKQKNPPHKL